MTIIVYPKNGLKNKSDDRNNKQSRIKWKYKIVTKEIINKCVFDCIPHTRESYMCSLVTPVFEVYSLKI